MKPYLYGALIMLYLFAGCTNNAREDEVYNILITYDDELSAPNGFDGRLLVLFSTNNETEPRFQISDGVGTAQVFGIDVHDWQPGESIQLSSEDFGYPLNSIDQLEEGDYFVQAVLHKYDSFQLKTGHTILLPMDLGEGQHWNRSPKNIYSVPVAVALSKNRPVEITISEEIPPIEPPLDTEYIRHVRMRSELLSEFWGRDMYLQANVLVPHDFDSTGNTEYPLMIFHGHFPYTFRGFRTEPPEADPDDGVYTERFGITGYQYIQEKEAYDFYQKWISDEFPRFIVIEIQHQNPYYDDSYAVNSANLGPYGDAITYELIPHVEELFNGVGEGWGRFLYGGSTGGWEALAVQVKYPEEYNGCFAACPDPIDFRAYGLVNIYEHENAYYDEGDFSKVYRPGRRDNSGYVSSTIRDMNHKELALGSNSRSGDQWDIWQAVYSPQGDDGYPKPIWNKRTGKIDPAVAAYWKENYDLRHIMERDWNVNGTKWEGKIHIYCGDMDNYYLNNAVRLTEEFLENTTDPYYNGEVDYGDMAEHCWNGDQENPNYISRLRYNTMYLPKIRKRLKQTAPSGNKLVNWK
jgi:hypothetical protein